MRLNVLVEHGEAEIDVQVTGPWHAIEPPYQELILLDRPHREATHRIADRLADLVEVYADPARMQRMHQLCTSNPIAYLRLEAAEADRREFTRHGLQTAAALLGEAIAEDPALAPAYELLVMVHHDLAKLGGDAHARAELAQSLSRVRGTARRQGAPQPLMEGIETRLRQYTLMRPGDAETLWRTAASTGTPAFRLQWLRCYGDLLCGAGWDEARAQITSLLVTQLPHERAWIELDLAPLAALRNQRALEYELRQAGLERFPECEPLLHGLVEHLAFARRFEEAEAGLARLEVSDAHGAWAHAARLTLRTLRGQLPAGSAALAEAAAHPLTTNAIRGRLAFMLGDVPAGVRYWQALEPAHAPWLWQNLAASEHAFAPGVVEDARYAAVLEHLGLGREWIERLRTGFNALAAVHGLRPTPDGTLPTRRGAGRFQSASRQGGRRGATVTAPDEFTAAERRLLDALQRGLTLAEYARTSSRSIHTVRNQLKQLLHKTGSRRQADLLRRYPGISA